MRWLLLADVHANLEALHAVLADAEPWSDARLVVAGDLVGYGPDPEACVALLRERGALCVAGNHEAMVVGRLDPERCNPTGCHAARWTRTVLGEATLAWLSALPQRLRVSDRLLVCHGSLDDVELYVDRPERARLLLAAAGGPGQRVVCGHTHRPVCFDGSEQWDPPGEDTVRLDAARSYLINPGSVGQARYEAPVARYARYDDVADTLTHHAVAYDHQRHVAKLHQHGLVLTRPPWLTSVAGRLRRAARRLAL